MGKCKYWKKCNLFSEESTTCTLNDGCYYEDRPSGCYILMEARRKENKTLDVKGGLK